MMRGIYTGASGMKAQMHRMDALSNNLANVDTTGYKKDTSVSKAFPQMLIKRTNGDGVYKFPFGSAEMAPTVGKLGTGVEYNESYTVFKQGELKQTNNPFDMALDGKGFFTIQTAQGERYTRDGSFIINEEGTLVTKDGNPVLGKEGKITLKENNFTVDKMGNIYRNATFAGNPERMVSKEENEWENMEKLDTLKVVEFPKDRFLKKQGDNLWDNTAQSGEARMMQLGTETKVEQGFVENSNVNPVTQMVNMIEVNRAYEANQRVIKTHDQMTGKLINEALRV